MYLTLLHVHRVRRDAWGRYRSCERAFSEVIPSGWCLFSGNLKPLFKRNEEFNPTFADFTFIIIYFGTVGLYRSDMQCFL